ncbi:hypothetical protein F2P81_003526 [Scophthalmus maximus]|uniref:Uncharacterized protein n=1 Tax=Scophthalmus maximus TaxID=52904 RepID=A0A6A4TIP6_SCOMX|nr:hypothetical protein F2P81_003526 [Scophthalmus maximus]
MDQSCNYRDKTSKLELRVVHRKWALFARQIDRYVPPTSECLRRLQIGCLFGRCGGRERDDVKQLRDYFERREASQCSYHEAAVRCPISRSSGKSKLTSDRFILWETSDLLHNDMSKTSCRHLQLKYHFLP